MSTNGVKLLAAIVVALLLTSAADAAAITAVDRTNGTSGDRSPIGIFNGDTDPLATEAGGLIDGNIVFSDRDYPWIDTPGWAQGSEYVRTFNTDKGGDGSDTVNYAVTFGEAVYAFLSIDDRFGGDAQAKVDAVASGLPAGTFQDTGWDLTIDEGGGRPMSIYSASLPADTYNFGPCPSDYNFHQIGVLPVEPPPLPLPPRQTISFTYSTVTGTGMISGNLDARGCGGPMELYFSAPMPTPVTVDPNSTLTPAGDVGTIKEQSGSHNEEPLKTVGLQWSGEVELTASDGVTDYSVFVDLVFGPSGDSWSSDDDPLSSYDPFGENFDYDWEVVFSDEGTAPEDAVGNPRMAIFYGVGREEANGKAHRLTQIQYLFEAGPDDPRTNTDDTASGDPRYSKFAAYQDLGLYFGWRDRDTLGGGSFQVDSIVFSGNLLVDSAAIVPEPSTFILAAMALLGLGLYAWRKRS